MRDSRDKWLKKKKAKIQHRIASLDTNLSPPKDKNIKTQENKEKKDILSTQTYYFIM